MGYIVSFLTLIATGLLVCGSTISPRFTEESETTSTSASTSTPSTSTEPINVKDTLIGLLPGPLIPATFLKPRHEVLCDKSTPYVGVENEMFVEELPNPLIEGKIREITNAFVETLKHDKAWFVSLLFHIRKAQKQRESEECSEAECIYKIPCYLSQRPIAVSLYNEVLKRARVREGFDLLRRRRRSLDGLDPETEYNSIVSDGNAPVTNCTGVYANYCYNSISCIYVRVLESAACS